MGPLIAIALKSLIVAGGVLLILKLASGRSASDRSLIAHLGLAAVLLLPVGWMLLPPLGVSGPQFLSSEPSFSVSPVAVADPGVVPIGPPEIMATASKETTGPLAGVDPALLIYLVPALLLAGLTVMALVQLVSLKARAKVLVEPEWVTALARAQQRMGFKHGTALLTSDELPSPISWGVVRPVILLNNEATNAHRQAEAVIAHELAHVAHLDWAKLLLARIVVALFWFNPLVWLLSREAHQLREEAADDAVLAANIEDTEYAQLLVSVARHECRGLLIGAHGVAPSKDSLSRRVRRVLDAALERAPGGWRWSSAAAFFAAGMAVPLAALTVVPGASATPPAAAVAGIPAGTIAASNLPAGSNTVAADATRPATAARIAAEIEPQSRSIVSPGGQKMIVDSAGRAIMSTPVGTFVSGADGSAVIFANGQTIAAARSGKAVAVGDSRIQRAVEMRALGATAEYASSLRSAMPGVRISDGQLVQLKAVGVTRDYIRGLAAAGYRGLNVSTLVEFRALGIMPSDIVSVRQATGRLPTPQEMVQITALGVSPGEIDAEPDEDHDPDDGS